MNAFFLGATATYYAIAGLFFLRYWRRSHDRLFIMFAAAFWILAANRTAFFIVDHDSEYRSYLYLVRLVAFVVVLAAIVDKNRKSV